MALLNPFMLIGIAGVSVPILIHLLNRRKFQRLAWAAMRFVIASVKKNQRRLRIEDLLLLLLRCALLVLLALALARPTVRGAAAGLFGSGRVTAVLVLDNSASMSTTDGVHSRFDLARQAAEQTLEALPGGSPVAVLLANNGAQALIAEPTLDRNLVRQTIRNAALSDRSGDLLPAVRQAIAVLHNHPEARQELYVFTDRSRLAWRQLATLSAALKEAGKALAPHVVLVGSAEERNLGVSDLRLASGLAPVDRMARVEVRVSNHGAQPAQSVRVSLAMDDQPPADEATIPAIAPGTSQTTALHVRFPSRGYHTLTAAIVPDHMPADDRRTIAVRAIDRVTLLLVDGDPGREPRDGETFFLRNALVPVAPAESERYFVRAKTVSTAELAAERLEDYDALVLANVADLAPATVEALVPFLRRGGGLIVFPGENTQRGFYNRELFARQQFLSSEYGAPRGDADAKDQGLHLQDRNFEHPIAALWNDPASGRPSAATFYRTMPLTEPKSAPGADQGDAGAPLVVLRFADGTPAVMERPWGLGRVIQFSSTADTAWNDLATRTPGVYLPLLYRVLGSIVQRQDEALNVAVGQPLAYRADADLLGRDALIDAPGARDKGTRASRKLEMKDRGVILQFDQTDLGGAYTATINSDPQRIVKFAAQPDPAESNLSDLLPSQLQALGQSAQVIAYEPGASIRATFQNQRAGVELWLPLALLVVLIAGVETYLAFWFSESK